MVLVEITRHFVCKPSLSSLPLALKLMNDAWGRSGIQINLSKFLIEKISATDYPTPERNGGEDFGDKLDHESLLSVRGWRYCSSRRARMERHSMPATANQVKASMNVAGYNPRGVSLAMTESAAPAPSGET